MNKFLIFGLNHKILTFIFVIGLSIYASLGYNKLKFDIHASSALLKKELYQYSKNKGKVSTKSATDIIYVEFNRLIDTRAIKELQSLINELSLLDVIESIDSIFTVSNLHHDGEILHLGPVIPDPDASDSKIKQQIKKAIQNKLLAKRLISEEGYATTIYISLDNKKLKKIGKKAAYHNINNTIKNNKNQFKNIFLIGKLRLHQETKETILKEFKIFIPLMMLMFLVVTYFFHQYWLACILPISIAAITIFWTFGIMGNWDIPINPMSVILPFLFIVVSSTEDIHLFSYYKHILKSLKPSESREIAADLMLKKVGKCAFLMMFTTTIAFLFSTLTPYRIISDFGYAACIGLVLNGFLTLHVTPLILSSFGRVPDTENTFFYKIYNSLENKLQVIINNIIFNKARLTIILILVAFVFSVISLTKMTFTHDPYAGLKQNHSLIIDKMKFQDQFSGYEVTKFKLEPTNKKDFTDPKNLQAAFEFTNYIMEQPEWDNVQSITNIVSHLNQEVNDGNPLFNTIPKTKIAIEQLFYLIGKDTLKKFLSSKNKQLHMYVYHHMNERSILQTNTDKLMSALENKFGSKLDISMSSQPLRQYKASKTLFVQQSYSLLLILIIVFCIFTFLFVSIRIGLISLLPNVIPIILTLGLMPLLDIQLGIMTIIVAVVGVGLAVDDTLHFLIKYQDNCHQLPSNSQALQTTIKYEILPIVSTSAALIISFLMLGLSDFKIAADFGILLAIVIFFATVCDLTITPILVSKFRFVNIWNVYSLSVADEIKNSPFFKGLNKYEIKTVLLISSEKSIAKGNYIKLFEEKNKNLYFLLEGLIEIRSKNIKTGLKYYKKPGSLIGIVHYLTNKGCEDKLFAYTACKMLFLNEASITTLSLNYPRIAYKLTNNVLSITANFLQNEKVFLDAPFI